MPSKEKHNQYVERSASRFLFNYFLKEMNRRWYAACCGNAGSLVDWSKSEAAVLAANHKPLLLRARYKGKQVVRRRNWVLVIKQLMALSLAYEPLYRERLIWIHDDIFIDPANVPIEDVPSGYLPLAEVGTLADVPLQTPDLSLKELTSAWCRIRRNHDAQEISEQMILDEIQIVRKLRQGYKERRQEDERKALRKIARTDPEEALKKVKSSCDDEHDDRGKTQLYWEALLIYAPRSQSAFHEYLFSVEQKNSIARAAALVKRSKNVHKQARSLDYQLRLLNNFGHDTLMFRKSLIKFVRKTSLPNSKLEKLLRAMHAQKTECFSSFFRFIHDIHENIIAFDILPPSVYFSDLMNSVRDRNVSNILPLLKTIYEAPFHFRHKATSVPPYPKNLSEAATRILKVTKDDLIKKFNIKLAGWDCINNERLLHNSLKNGVTKIFLWLLERNVIRQQSFPRHLCHDVFDGRVSLEVSNLSVVDGWLAMALPQICIRFGGSEHIGHFHCDAAYLCIYHKDDLIMSGMLVNAGSHILLNNFQGKLPTIMNTEEKKHEMCRGIQEIMNQLDKPVVMRDFYFNAISLAKTLNLPKENLKLDLPQVRLDCSSEGDFYVLSGG